MRSRAARLTFGAVAWIALSAATFFLVQSERQITDTRASLRAFDLHAREATDALADLRAAQQAYVAAGQGVAFWMPKVAATLDTATRTMAALGQSATSLGATAALGEASSTVAEFSRVDKRARDYIHSEQPLMAADVIFTEGGETAAAAARQVESARLAEHQAVDASDAARRKQEATAMAGAGALAAMVIALLVPGPRLRATDYTGDAHRIVKEPLTAPPQPGDDLMLRGQAAPSSWARAISPVLRTAAELCTDFGRVRDLDDLTTLLTRAADVMDASGLMVWLGSVAGADLRPVLAHGYSAQAIARMPTVPRSADNAAAAAYRTGTLQIVLARPGTSEGAVVAPLLSSEGCIGALSAEIRSGGETSDSVQALATIFAAHLAGVLGTAPADAAGAAGGNKAAASS